MRRFCLAVVLFACLAPSAGAAPVPASWAQPQIAAVVGAGLLAPSEAAFRPNDPLTWRDLQSSLLTLAAQRGVRTAAGGVPAPATPVSIRQLDAALVTSLGLGDAGAQIARALAAAGLSAPQGTGTETLARLLRFRVDHPAAQDDLEPLPDQAATRAEAAYSFARLLTVSVGDVDQARALAASVVLPALSPWQRAVLQTAVAFVGYPYVWGGTSELPEAPFGVQAQGGFDCSGFLWRVYKQQPYEWAPQLASVLRGRTTMVLSAEVPVTWRVPLGAIEPADVLFFGAQGPRSKPAQISHASIYLGGGWMIQAGHTGVTLVPVAGWYLDHFAWARRPLAEATQP